MTEAEKAMMEFRKVKTPADLVRFIRKQRKDAWKRLRPQAEAELAAGNVEGFFGYADSADRANLLVKYSRRLREQGLLEKAFLVAYTSQKETNHRDGWFWYATLEGLDKGRLKAASAKIPARFGDTLTIYRGVVNPTEKNIRNISWTLSLKTAKWFAHRWEPDLKGVVYQTTIQRSDVLAYIGRDEQEILVLLSPTHPIEETNL